MQSSIPCPALLCLPFLRTTFLRPHPPCCETHPGLLRSTILRPTPSATHLLVTHPSSAHFPATPVPVARPSATHPTATRSSAMHLLRSTLLGPTMPSVSRIRTARLWDCILQSAFPGPALLCSVLPLMLPGPSPSCCDMCSTRSSAARPTAARFRATNPSSTHPSAIHPAPHDEFAVRQI